LITVGPCGHINPESGFGPWPLGLALLAELQREIEQRGKPSLETDEGHP
jgi:predicted alpha/beta hydrolase family esterase